MWTIHSNKSNFQSKNSLRPKLDTTSKSKYHFKAIKNDREAAKVGIKVEKIVAFAQSVAVSP